MNQNSNQNSDQNSATKKSNGLNAIIWTCVAVLIILLLLTAILLTLSLGNFLPNETDILFLIPKEPDFDTADDKGVWTQDTEIEVFKTEYVNGENIVVVKSGNGDQIIAPGTENVYKFYLQNNGNIAVNYAMDLSFFFTVGGEKSNFENIPLLVRLYSDDGSYLIGTAEHLVPVANAVSASDVGTLGINSYDAYTLEIVWEFEGTDALDTWLGNISESDGAVFGLSIATYAEENPDPKAEGGLPSEGEQVTRYGGSIRWLPFTILIVLILALAGVLAFLLVKKRQQTRP